MINQKFNRLTVISLYKIDEKSRKFYKCLCDCGKFKVVNGALLRSNNTKSCGCLGKEMRKLTRKPNNHGVIYQIYLGYLRHAKDRKLSFKLNKEEFRQIISQPCFYCGLEPSNIKKTKSFLQGFKYSGIDRIDSSNGYNMDNVVPCCKLCNLAKRDLTLEQFLNWVKRVFKFQNLKPD